MLNDAIALFLAVLTGLALFSLSSVFSKEAGAAVGALAFLLAAGYKTAYVVYAKDLNKK